MAFTVHSGDKVAVVGANGVGKSSLFALITGELEADAGAVALPSKLTLAYLAQETPATRRAAIEYVIDGDGELREVEAELSRAEADGDGGLIAALHSRLETLGGYAARARAGRLMYGLGFSAADESRPLAEFSGGWRMRLNLARTLMCRSDLLLLDEPTNHLDLDALLWLEQWLKGYPGTLLIISHDRVFLDAVAGKILNLAHGGAQLYTGNYSAFEEQRAERIAGQRSAYAKQQRDIAHMRRFVERFRYKATKARQAQSRVKALERMEHILPAHLDSPFDFSFREPRALPRPLIRFEGASAGYAAQPLIRDIDIDIAPGDRIGLLGRNGAGKSTLIRLLAGALQPMSGKHERASGLACGYFAQHQLEQLDVDASPLLHFSRLDPEGEAQGFRDLLGGFGIHGDKALDPVAGLSGGEKARLTLALLIWRRPNLLLLDEPTNHLDLEMRHALTLALQGFSGAIVVVSHDRHLMDTVADDLWLVEAGRLARYPEDLGAYVRSLTERRDAAPGDGGDGEAKQDTVVRRKQRRREGAKQRLLLTPLKNTVSELEAELEALSRERESLTRALADPALYGEAADKAQLGRLMIRRGEVERALEIVEARWLSASERLEAGVNGAGVSGDP
jgi:ATP-binding cassette subfamily F protein 3